MNRWWEGDFFAWDLETTGVDLDEARIVTACATLVKADGTVSDTVEFLVNPGVEIPKEASDVHGITTEMAVEMGGDPKDAITDLALFITDALTVKTPVVAFNARFDFSILDRECRRHGIPTLDQRTAGLVWPVLDPYVLDKAADKYRRGKRTLSAMSELYGVELTDAHNATADAIAGAQVARAVIRTYRGLQMPTAGHLHHAQEIWAKQQAMSLERHLREKNSDPTIVLDKEWPVVPAQGEAGK